MRRAIPCVLFAILSFRSVRGDEPPAVPAGLDAYRMWEKWPQQRIGVRAYMRSTYDRRGGNEGADASHFLYQKADDFNVSLDVAGPGVLYFARYNHWHGSPWHYVVDGTDHVVTESSTPDPNKPVEGSTFLPKDVLPNPLTWTWSDTKGADLMWVPVGFEKSFQMAYARTRYGTGYYIYHQFVPGTKLSQPIKAWDGKTPPDKDVLDLIGRTGRELFPGDKADGGGSFVLSRGDSKVVARLDNGPRVIRNLQIMIPKEIAGDAHGVRLRVTWDGRAAPSIDAPLPLFFGAGRLYSRDGRDDLVKAFPMTARFEQINCWLECRFPMPYFRSARIELVNESAEIIEGFCNVATEPLAGPPSHVGYFHATYKDHGPNPETGKDLVLLNTREAEGGGDWSGSFVGTSWIFSHNANLGTLEGDPRFYFDDTRSPHCSGTGTAEWGGGGDYWGGRNMTLPFAGHPCGAKDLKSAKNEQDKIESAYRFLLADLMPFGKNARITLEHGGENNSKEHYETVAYWYGLPAASLVKTDELAVGDAASEKAHTYQSLQASESVEVTSRYEWGVDTLNGKEVFPPQTDRGRTTKGTSEFTLKIRPDNFGVMLRRKLDYQYPNQRAEVFVADAAGEPLWKPAGVWYLAGSNTCVYSNPKEELGATQHIVQTSNRRFRDDEFLIGTEHTQGRSAIRVRVKFTPVDRALFPGHPFPVEPAWSEMRYSCYCYVMPEFKPSRVRPRPSSRASAATRDLGQQSGASFHPEIPQVATAPFGMTVAVRWRGCCEAA
jgi:hypothetical protein